MKKTTFFIIWITLLFQVSGQINPVQNLKWEQSYVNYMNIFSLTWEKPESPHNELIGYKIYRNNELYRFQTKIGVFYNPMQGANSDSDFINYNNSSFTIHVTAVYNPGEVESGYTETIHVEGAALGTSEIKQKHIELYPNPTDGKFNIRNIDLNKILVFDANGKMIKELKPQPTIDLSGFPKGIYILKLVADKETFVEKVILK